jgi:sec-independent protein translocase protein TatA
MGVQEILILLLIASLLFGASRLPRVGRSLGTGMREFRDGLLGKEKEESDLAHDLGKTVRVARGSVAEITAPVAEMRDGVADELETLRAPVASTSSE